MISSSYSPLRGEGSWIRRQRYCFLRTQQNKIAQNRPFCAQISVFVQRNHFPLDNYQVQSHFFTSEMWFFLKKICYFKNNPYLCTRKGPVRAWAGDKINFVEWDLRPVVRPVSKGRFRNVTVCTFKLSKLGSIYSGDATEAFACRMILYPCAWFSLYIYNKVCPRGYCFCVYWHWETVRW